MIRPAPTCTRGNVEVPPGGCIVAFSVWAEVVTKTLTIDEIEKRVEAGELDGPPNNHLAHLVLKPEWPIALCGANVSERFGVAAPAMDRCTDCLRIARERKLGRPGWK